LGSEAPEVGLVVVPGVDAEAGAEAEEPGEWDAPGETDVRGVDEPDEPAGLPDAPGLGEPEAPGVPGLGAGLWAARVRSAMQWSAPSRSSATVARAESRESTLMVFCTRER
jgi:hypothetical protein